MKHKEKINSPKSKKITLSTILYIAAAVVALITVASLADNIILYRNSVSQYVAQGYPAALVIKQLIPSQLLPGLFDTISVYGGIAFILFGIGVMNKKVSNCLPLLNKNENCGSVADVNGNNTEVSESAINSETKEEADS